MLLIYQRRSFTLVEIMVTTVILSLVMWGILGIFIAGKRQIMHSRGRITASEMGKLFLDPLQMAVNQTTWDNTTSNALSVGTTYCDSDGNHTQNPLAGLCPSVISVDSVNYTARYDVDNVNVTGTNLRRVKVKANWTEFSP